MDSLSVGLQTPPFAVVIKRVYRKEFKLHYAKTLIDLNCSWIDKKVFFIKSQNHHYSKLTVSFRTVMKLMRKFFLDSKSDNNRFKSDFVTLLRTPASSTTYDSFGGPSLRTSNSDANAEPVGKTGQKLRAKDRARAASPWWACDNQLFGSDNNGFADWEDCFLRLDVMGLVIKEKELDLGWLEGEKMAFEEEGLRLTRGEGWGQRMVSMKSECD